MAPLQVVVDGRESLFEVVVFVVVLVLAILAVLVAVAAAVAGIWGLAHLLPWVAMHNRGLAIFLVLAALLWGGSRVDPVTDRLEAIHTTLMMRR